MKQYNLKIGLFGIGLEAYWEQFEGLKERLEGYVEVVEGKLKTFATDIVNLGYAVGIADCFQRLKD